MNSMATDPSLIMQLALAYRASAALFAASELDVQQGRHAARNILGAREPFVTPPFFWSNHFDLQIRYVGHGSGDDHAIVSGNLKEKEASVTFRSADKLTAVASVGRDLENLKAEAALEHGQEFHSS